MHVELFTSMTAVGVSEERAKAVVLAMDSAMDAKIDYGQEGMRRDIESLHRDIQALDHKIDLGLNALRGEMKSMEQRTDASLAGLRGEMRAMESRLDTKIDSVGREIGYVKWYAASAVPATALVLGLLNYLKA
ncbi:hypothetical protein [Pigmentiphaga sp. CHJ604]|uniref:hypothetical protein n=1 Tax=Pigmentiphaga sp. CHJ604 TaxID=3081984 RepID=UPI0030D4408B